jgi:hypothetical protein
MTSMTSTDTPALELAEQELDAQEPETPNRRSRSSLKRLKDRLKILDKIASDPKVKAAKQADVALEASSIEKLLFQTEREDKADKNLAELATANAEVSRLSEENARLTRLTAELQSRTAQRVTPERIPDAVLQEQVQTLEALLKSVAALARGVDVESRARLAVSLVIKYKSQAVRSVIEGMGVDYASVVTTLQKPKAELLSLLQQAEREGAATPLQKAVLFVRDGITAAIGKQQPRVINEFKDFNAFEFSDEYERL